MSLSMSCVKLFIGEWGVISFHMFEYHICLFVDFLFFFYNLCQGWGENLRGSAVWMAVPDTRCADTETKARKSESMTCERLVCCVCLDIPDETIKSFSSMWVFLECRS